MDKKQLENYISSIRTAASDEAQLTSILTSLLDDGNKLIEEYENNKTTKTQLEESIKSKDDDMEKLRKANLDLFLRVGSPEQKTDVVTPPEVDKDEPKKMEFKDLFDEKGEIK